MKNREEWEEGAYHMVSKMYFGQKFVNFFYKFVCMCVCFNQNKIFQDRPKFYKEKDIQNFFEKHFTMKKIKPYSTTKKKWQNLDALCRFLN